MAAPDAPLPTRDDMPPPETRPGPTPVPATADSTVPHAPTPTPSTSDPARQPPTLEWAAPPAVDPFAPTLPYTPHGRPLPRIPGYVVVRRLGGGGMGDVYEAVNRLGVRFALKLIRTDLADPEFQARFRVEAATLQELDHPHIARIFEYNECDGVPYFTMRLLTGDTLEARAGEFRSDPGKAVALAATVAEAVGYLHRRGLLHRDLKPSNILFDDDDRPVVADFGLVKPLDRAAPRPAVGGERAVASAPAREPVLTDAGRVPGTKLYMSPEQLRGEGERVGPWSDVWALGVILCELLTGRRPFDGPTLDAVRDGAEPPPPADLGMDEGLAAIVRRCFGPRPEDRYASADLLAADLHGWLAARDAPPPVPLLERPGRRRWPWAVVAAGLVLVAVLAAVFLRPRPDLARELLERLARNKEVELIGEKGEPKYPFEVVCGPPGGKPYYLATDGAFTLDTTQLVLVELVPPDSCPAGYRLKSKVRFNDVGGEPGVGRGGLYLGHSQRETASGPMHLFLEWSFTDDYGPLAPPTVPPPPPGQTLGNYALMFRRYVEPPDDAARYPPGYELNATFLHTKTPPGKQAAWHDLEVEFTHQTVRVWWDGKEVGAVPRADIDKHASLMFRKSVQPPPTFEPAGGLGLLAFKASVSFGRTSLVPLTE